jgi:lipoyl-dependent peroxiredoxin
VTNEETTDPGGGSLLLDEQLRGSTVAAKVGIGPNRQRGYGLAVALSVSLPVLDADIAAKLVDAAHEVCPYSNATRGNIDVTILLG